LSIIARFGSEALESDYKLRTLKRSTVAIASVVLVELVLGLTVNSLAIVSDGLHALLDALTTFMLLIATRVSAKPPDEEHMYGHEKFESIGGFVGGIALIGIASLIIYEAILKIMSNQTVNLGIEYVGFIAIGYTFCIDFFRVGTFMRARKGESTTMKAGYYHALADLSSTVIAFFGFGLATLGFYFGDSLASLVLGVLLTYLSVKLVWSSGLELTDTVSKEVAEKVRKEILGTEEVCNFGNLKIRKAGDKTFVRATLQVPDYMGLEEAHNLASKVEIKIKNILGNAEVAIHTEPCEAHMSTAKLVEKLATEVEGVKDAHEVNIAYAEGKLYITLHAYVDPKLSIERAHEIAEKIEERIRQKMRNVEDIAVHIEPFSKTERKGTAVDENEVRTIIHRVADNYQHAFRVKGIVTYVAGKKRYINIDCSFTKQISIEDAHRIASQIEEQIREHFVETTVTVHTEPG
jgi:cation diffusion facilitator family transporter